VTHIHGRVTDRAVDVQILRLRKKLGSDIIEIGEAPAWWASPDRSPKP